MIELFVIVFSQTTTNIGKLVRMSDVAEKTGAVCLDGTAPTFYFAPGSESKKYAFFFQGGGWCESESACFQRCNSHLGSTINDTATLNMDHQGFLITNCTESPLLCNWNKIYARYCDGASWAGDVNEPIINPKNSSQKMYYRGKRILDAIFTTLINNYGFGDATDFVVGGGSAGGLSAFLHTKYIADNYVNLDKTFMVSLPDVGYFIEYNGYNGKTNWANNMKYLYNMQNMSGIMDDKCLNKSNGYNNSECVFAQNIARNNNPIPTFVLNSQYDEYQANSILGTGTSNPALLNEYGQNFTKLIINDYLVYNKTIYGAYIDGCYHHDANDPIYWTGLNIDGYTQATAFKQFYEGVKYSNGTRVFWYQNVTYPCTKCCP